MISQQRHYLVQFLSPVLCLGPHSGSLSWASVSGQPPIEVVSLHSGSSAGPADSVG